MSVRAARPRSAAGDLSTLLLYDFLASHTASRTSSAFASAIGHLPATGPGAHAAVLALYLSDSPSEAPNGLGTHLPGAQAFSGIDASTFSPHAETAPPTPAADVWTFLEMTGLLDIHTMARERLAFLGGSVADVEVALGSDDDLGGEYAEIRVFLRAESRARFRELHSLAMDALLEAFEGRDLSRLVIALLRSA